MAILTPAQLQSSNASTYTTNGTNSITGADARDFNVDFISSSITVSQTGSMSVASASIATSASYAATASVVLGTVVSASYALTASLATYANNFTASNVLITGTASVSFLNVEYQTSSIIYSSGSNQFGDAINDVQTLWGTVVLPTGSIQITGSAYGNIVPVSVASNTASINLAAGNFFTVTLANSATTFFNLTNVRPGVTANLILTTGTVSTASFSSNVKQPSGNLYLPTSGSGQIDALSLIAVDSSNVYLVASKKFV
jgi:hypothetical protein